MIDLLVLATSAELLVLIASAKLPVPVVELLVLKQVYSSSGQTLLGISKRYLKPSRVRLWQHVA